MIEKRSWSRTLVLALLAAVLLGSCAQMFDFNLYQKLDPVPVPVVTDYEGADGLDELEGDLDSPAIVDTLVQNPETITQIEDMLEEDYLNDGVTTEEDQQAAILYAELNLETSGGDELVNNMVNTVTTVLESEDPAALDPLSIITQVIPPEAAESPEVFTSMLLGLLDANNAYVLFGDSIGDVNGDGAITAGEDVPAGTNMGGIAQCAVVAYAVELIVESMGLPPADAGNQLWLLLYEPTSPEITITEPTLPDVLSTPPTFLLNIFASAGVPLDASLFGGSGT